MIIITNMAGGSGRWTKQLKAIVDIVYSSEASLTADQVYSLARKRLPNISLGTVYRNLNKLVTDGLVSETQKGNTSVFMRHPFTNATFECEGCGRLFCVSFEIRNQDIERQVGMTVSRWNMRISGLCRECATKCT